MEELNLKEALVLVKKYNKMTPKEREPIQKQRFYAMVTWARKHNPIYAEHFKNLGINFFMRDVPYIERNYLLENKDLWKSDSVVNMEVEQAINTIRSFSFDRDYYSFILKKSRAVIISSSDGSLQQAAWSKSTTVLSVFSPIDELVNRLNEIRPAFLWAYPSTLEKLLEYKMNGRLNIKPVLIIAGGEHLTDRFRSKLINEFGSTVQATYTSAEFGIVASECQMGHLHVNDDWIILEGVDEKGKPCTSTETPAKILITNMYKTDYPIIRMTLPDNVRFHKKPCDCGNPSPCISIIAAKDDLISLEPNTMGDLYTPPQTGINLQTNNGEVELRTEDFNSLFSDISGIINYQLLIYANNNISVRLSVEVESMKPILFLQAEQNLRKFLKEKGINASAITMDADAPLQDEQNGKLKNIIDCR